MTLASLKINKHHLNYTSFADLIIADKNSENMYTPLVHKLLYLKRNSIVSYLVKKILFLIERCVHSCVPNNT